MDRAEACWLRWTTQKRGREELRLPRGQGGDREHQAVTVQERLRGAIPRPRSGEVAERSYPTPKVRRGSREEILLVQGQEQRLRFAGTAMKRYPMSKVRETQVRW